MKRIPDFPPNVFHRIRPPANPKLLSEMIANGTTGNLKAELTSEFRTGHGLVMASGEGIDAGKVEALGVVIAVKPSGDREVHWTLVQFELRRSERGGGQFWRQEKPTFRFAKTVAEEIDLKQEFRKYCRDPFVASRTSKS